MIRLVSIISFCFVIVLVSGRVDISTDSFACRSCLKLMALVDDVAASGMTIEVAERVAIEYCILNKGGLGYGCRGDWQCKDMCTGAVRAFAPIVFESGTRMKLNPHQVCATMRACPHSPSRIRAARNSSINLYDHVSIASSMIRDARFPRHRNDSDLRIVHISDVHLDLAYQVGSDTDCGQPLCARKIDGVGPSPERRAGFYADYNGDTSVALLHSLTKQIAALKPDLIFFTGDTPPHNVWSQSRKLNIDVLKVFTDKLQAELPTVPVFPVLGNHASFPVDQYNPKLEVDAQWLYKPMAERWAYWLPGSTLETFSKFGYYTTTVPGHDKLRIIGLNTNIHNSGDFWLWPGDDDWGGMFTWLERVLNDTERNNETFYLLGHHPPDSTRDFYRNRLYRLLLQHRERFAGAFWGHTHDDTIAVMMDDQVPPVPVGVQYIVPSVTTFSNHNPSFRVFELDTKSYRLVDYHQYRVDLAKQMLENNLSPSTEPKWEIAYSAKQAYGLQTMGPDQWLDLLIRMKTDDHLLLYYLYQSNTGRSQGDVRNRVDTICDSLSFTSAQYMACHNSSSS